MADKEAPTQRGLQSPTLPGRNLSDAPDNAEKYPHSWGRPWDVQLGWGARNFELTESGKDAWSIMSWKPQNTCQVQWHEKEIVHSKLMKDQKNQKRFPFPCVMNDCGHVKGSSECIWCIWDLNDFNLLILKHATTRPNKIDSRRRSWKNSAEWTSAWTRMSPWQQSFVGVKFSHSASCPLRNGLDVWQHGECQCECHSLYPGLGSMDFKLGSLNRYGMHCLFSSPRCSSEPLIGAKPSCSAYVPVQAPAHPSVIRILSGLYCELKCQDWNNGCNTERFETPTYP